MREGCVERGASKGAARLEGKRFTGKCAWDVKARTLSVEEAIGNPEGDDFPLQKGKERLMEATVNGARGQAFTDRFGDYSGTLGQVAELELNNKLSPCRVRLRAECGAGKPRPVQGDAYTVKTRFRPSARGKLVEYIQEKYGNPKITHVGFQPAMVRKNEQGI